MFGRKKTPDETSTANQPQSGAASVVDADALPPMPARPLIPVAPLPNNLPPRPGASTPGTAIPNPLAAKPQGSNMAEPTTPTAFRPEISRRPTPDIPGAPPRPAAAADKGGSPDPKTLIVGREISLTGQITACDRLIVEGKVEASLSDSRFVEISESGTFKGTAEIHEAEIRGVFDGKLSVRGRLLIRGTGKVIGEVRYGQIEIECGGQISGKVETSGEVKPASTTYSAAD